MSARKVFALFGTIGITGVQEVREKLTDVEKTAKIVEKQIGKLGKSISNIGVGMSKTITAPLIGLGAAMVLAADKTGEYADKMLDLKEITGLSTDNLQRLEHVAEMTGSDFNALTNTIVQFTRKLPSIVKEGGPAYDSIKKLGINIFDASGNIRDMNELFPDMLKKLMAVENVTERNAMATTIFGRSLDDLAPILGLTTDEFDKLFNELKNPISEESLKIADQYREEMARLKEEFTSFWRQLAIDFIPIFKDSLIPLMRDTLLPVFEKVINTVKSVSDWFMGLSKAERDTIFYTVGFVAALGPLLVVIGKVIVATKGFTTSLLLLKAPLLVNPFVLAATAVATLTFYIVNLRKEHQKYLELTAKGELTKKGIELLKEKNRAMEDEAKIIKAAIDYAEEAKNKTVTWITAEGVFTRSVSVAKAELDAINDSIIKNNEAISKNTETTAGATKTTDELTKSLLKNANAQKEAEKNAKEAANNAKELAEKRMEYEESWSEKVRQEGFARNQLLEWEYKEAISKAEGNQSAIKDIELYYFVKRSKLAEDLADKKRDLAEKTAKAEEEAADKIANTEQKLHDKKLYIFNAISSAAIDYNNYMTQISDNVTQKKMMNLDAEQQKEIEAINNSVLNEEQKKTAIAGIEEKFSKKEARLKKEQAKRNKKMALFNAIIGTAASIVNAMQLTWPLNLVMAIIYGIMGAAQIAAIASEPIPMAEGGLIKATPGGVATTMGEAGQDEIALPMKTGVKALADALIERLSNISIPMPTLPRMALAGAGGGAMAAGVGNGGFTLNIYGTLIADDSGIKELERRMLKFRVAESQRKGG